jgi:hypothetical protein
MKLNDNSEAKKFLSELYTEISVNEDVKHNDYVKRFVLKTYTLLDKNYSLSYLFGRLRDDVHVSKVIDKLDNGLDYAQQIDEFSHNRGYAIY